jgi:hypothetical protein
MLNKMKKSSMKRRNQATRKNHYRKVTGGGPTKTPYEIDEFNKRYSELFTLLRQIEPAINKCINAFAGTEYERQMIIDADRRESGISAKEATRSHMDAVAASRGIRSIISQSKQTRSNRRNNSPKKILRSFSVSNINNVTQSKRITRTIRQQRSK